MATSAGGSRVVIKGLRFHYQGFNAVRKSPEVVSELTKRGKAIAAAAGEEGDYEVIVGANSTRARVVVKTATPEAMQEEASYRSLTRALGAGRG